MTEFLKIHSHGRIIFVRMIRPGAGFRVARSGEDWEQETKGATRKEMVLFSDADIIQRMRMNLHYAELEEVPAIPGRLLKTCQCDTDHVGIIHHTPSCQSRREMAWFRGNPAR